MPLIRVETSVPIEDGKKAGLLGELTSIVVETTGKPRQYVMAVLHQSDVSMGGKAGPAAYIDMRGIGGFSPEVNKKLAKAFCGFLQTSLGIKPESVFITFTDVPASNWGWNGGTFG